MSSSFPANREEGTDQIAAPGVLDLELVAHGAEDIDARRQAEEDQEHLAPPLANRVVVSTSGEERAQTNECGGAERTDAPVAPPAPPGPDAGVPEPDLPVSPVKMIPPESCGSSHVPCR